jgi:hypothetical protein
MIIFQISTGTLSAQDGPSAMLVQIGTGYAGNGAAINDPTATAQHAVGPLPVGMYVIGPPQDNPSTGPFSLPLTPDPANVMYGRGDFLVHGGLVNEPCDSPSVTPDGNRTASHGCIVTARQVRQVIATHSQLQVVA